MNSFFQRFAKGLVTNLKTIIQAIVFSIIIWFFISIQIFPDISMHITDIPVKCEQTNFMKEDNLQIVSVDTEKTAIQIEGKRYSISQLTADDFVAVADLSSVYEAGSYTVPVHISAVNEDTDCTITTGSVSAKIEVVKIVTREIPVYPNTQALQLTEGMQIEGDVTVTPSEIVITGEESLVDSIARVEAVAENNEVLEHTAAISASPVFYTTTGVKLFDPEIKYSHDNFTVLVPVYKVRTLPVKVKFTGGSGSYGFDPENLTYTMSINEITIASPDSSIDNLSAIDIGEIPLSSLTLKDLQVGVTLPVDLPEGYKNISGNRTITVTFPEADEFGQLGFTVPSENFTVINNPSQYDVKVLTNEMVVNVVGYSNYIQTMTSSDIYATINLLGMEIAEGSKSVSVTFRLKGSNAMAWVAGEEYKVDLLFTAAEENEEEVF